MPTVAVIGAGYWGKNLVRNLAELGALGGVCDVNLDRTRDLAHQHGNVRAYATPDDVFADGTIDAVSVAVPAELHYEVTRRALRAGKHCLVEKPLVLRLEQAIELRDLAKERGRILMVGHLLEHHPAVHKLRELIDSGELGDIYYLVSTRLNLGRIRQEENALWSLGVHDISMMLYLLGEQPDSVAAFGGNYITPGVADMSVAMLNFSHGVQGQIFVSWVHPYKEQKLVVVGSERMAVFDDAAAEHKLQLYAGKVEWVERRPVTRRVLPEPVEFDSTEPLRAECQHFLNCVETGQQPLTDAEDGLRVLRVLTACQSSLEEGGLPKRIDEPHFPGCKIHPTAVIDAEVRLGSGTQIWHFSHVLSGSVLGENCRVGQNVVIGPDVTIGRNVKVQNNVSVYKGVTLEDDVFCGPSMVFTNVFNPRAHIPRMKELREILVCKGATIGANATIICGHRIGRFAFIGAGAVVTRDVPDHALVFGNPARIAGWVCYCGEKLDFGNGDIAECPQCERRYRQRGDIVAELESGEEDV